MSIVFARSPRSSVGVEWELQIVNPDTGAWPPSVPTSSTSCTRPGRRAWSACAKRCTAA